MPYKKSPSTLEKSCIDIVISNIDRFKDDVSQLPHTLIDQILAKMTNFVHPRTQTLVIDCRMTGLENILTKVIDTCKMLKVLTLKGNSRKSSGDTIYDFTYLIRNLPQLEELELKWTATDKLLCEIGQHCPNLRRLYIGSTVKKAVTKRGILALCKDPSTGKSRNLALCHLTMDLPYPETPLNTYLVALRNLPNLTIFEPNFWFELLPHMEFEYANRTYPSMKYEHADRTYPSITDYGCESLCIEHLPILFLFFPNLRKINIMNSDKSFIYVMNVIYVVRRCLTELSLHLVDDLDISTIASSCPKLQTLELSYSSTKSDCQKMKKPFEELKELMLDKVRIREKVLFDVLINSPGLTTLKMDDCTSFSNSLVTDLCRRNALSEMRKLVIWYSKSDITLSLDGFKEILSMQNPLTTFNLYSCHSDQGIYNDLEKFITVNNLDVNFKFELYTAQCHFISLA